MNERLRNLKPYPKSRLDKLKADLRASGRTLFDFGTGDPGDETPEFIRRAMIDAVPAVSSYPTVQGSDELREAAAEYVQRRFGVSLDPAAEILATAGGMEAIFHTPMILAERGTSRELVIHGEPGYTVFPISAHFAEVGERSIALTAEGRYLLTPEAVGDETLARTAVVFLNYPHNPTGQELPPELFERWVLARAKHDFTIVSDEAYCDVYYEEPPRSLLEFGREGCLAVHSLSKRSGMTGYQTGFIAGDRTVLATLRRFRAAMGMRTPAWIEAAAAAAWREPQHVEARRAVFAEKRGVLLDVLAARGVDVYPGTAGIFLWVGVPAGLTDVAYAARLLEADIIVSPGSFYGPGQERFVRVALAPSIEQCREMRERWPEI